MLSGIEVFMKSEIVYPNDTFIIMALIFFAITILLMFISSKLQNHNYYTASSILALIAACTLLATVISFFLFLFCICPKKTGRYKYEVKIDDTVTVQELYQNYNVTNYDEQNGIFTIEDK